jgi:hypothetical protein
MFGAGIYKCISVADPGSGAFLPPGSGMNFSESWIPDICS